MPWLLLTTLLFAGERPAPSAAAQTGVPQSVVQTRDPDLLYADREHLPGTLEAAAVWQARLASNARDFEAAWKLARARCRTPAAVRAGG